MVLHNVISALEGDCVRTRRDLHAIPEIAFNEYKTQEYVLSRLASVGADRIEKIAGTGVKAVWYAPGAEKTVAFRADMDALAVEEKNATDYASRHPGFMHGCGHDGHMTILLMLAEMIARRRERLKVNVVLLFQPGEEGRGGARRVIAEGGLEDPHVDLILGCHVWPQIDKGRIGVRWGAQMAQTCELDFIVRGRSAHAASPQLGVDAVVCAAEFISVIQTAITRNVDPHQDALLTIGRIEGGKARNIIADRVDLNATVRVLDPDVYSHLMGRVYDIAEGTARALGAKIEVRELMSYPSVINPRPLVEKFYEYVDRSCVDLIEPSMAGEDFAFYQQKTPGLFFWLGIRGGKNHAPLHNEQFDFDEDALLGGVEIYCNILGLFGQEEK